MLDILSRAGCFVFIIFLGWSLRRIGVFKEGDFTVLSRIVIRITLPASIIASFSGKEIEAELLVLALIAMGCGSLYLMAGYLLNRRRSREQQAFAMLNLTGYNIGTFVLPFAQSFLGPMGVIGASLFDTGNAVMCLGGAFSVASTVKDGTGFSLKRIGKALSKSVPFICYILMLTMNLVKIPVPGFVQSWASTIGAANAFMAMLMIGVGFKLEGDPKQLRELGRLLAVRYGIGALLASVFYFLLPFAVEIRQALAILAVSPIGSAVPAFTEEMKGDVGMSSALNSLSILISITLTVILLSVML